MASAAQLAIAKGALSASLLRSDPTSPACPSDEIARFHTLLGEAVVHCSPTNVQKCKRWILEYITTSATRTAALGRYLVAYSRSTRDAKEDERLQRPSGKRRTLHVLYILHDVVCHVRRAGQASKMILSTLEPTLPDLVSSAAPFRQAPKHIQKLKDLVELWAKQEVWPSSTIDKINAAIASGGSAGGSDTVSSLVNGRTETKKTPEAPYMLPQTHGDPSAPWYDLPAGNWLPVIEPGSTRPMNPAMVKPLQFGGGTADKTIVDAVKALLLDVDRIYAKDARFETNANMDMGPMGEIIERDELTGDIVGGDTYYGWSRVFCEKMKAHRNGVSLNKNGHDRGRRDSRSYSRSPSRDRSRSRSTSSRPAHKRRRYSSVSSRSRSRSRYRGRERSTSRRRSRSRSRTGSPQRRDRSSSGGYSPPPAFASTPSKLIAVQQAPKPPPQGPPSHVPPPPQQYSRPPIPPPNGWQNMPIQPPPPPNYQGQWQPPVPPPPPPQGWVPPVQHGQQPPIRQQQQQPQQWGTGNSNGGWNQWQQNQQQQRPPPPPPPPPQQNQQNQQRQQNMSNYHGWNGLGPGQGW